MLQKITLFSIALLLFFPAWSSGSFDKEEFLNNVRLHAQNPDHHLAISKEDNITNAITCIIDDEGASYAVLKSEKLRSKREPFTYGYLEAFGLESICAPSFYIDDLELFLKNGETSIYQGAVEQFVRVDMPTFLDLDDEGSDSDLADEEILGLIDWMTDEFGSLNLLKIYNKIPIDYRADKSEIEEKKKAKQEILELFNDYIDAESAHKYFAALLLIDLLQKSNL